jgi:hypothetical protein
MGEERNRILELLAAGKITTEEAARLLDALAARDSPTPAAETRSRAASETLAKFLYIKVESTKGDNVNVKVPLSLVRAGLRLTSLIPPQAVEQINRSMAEHGMSLDLKNLRPEELEDLIESLREMEITVDSVNGENVRIYAA